MVMRTDISLGMTFLGFKNVIIIGDREGFAQRVFQLLSYLQRREGFLCPASETFPSKSWYSYAHSSSSTQALLNLRL